MNEDKKQKGEEWHKDEQGSMTDEDKKKDTEKAKADSIGKQASEF